MRGQDQRGPSAYFCRMMHGITACSERIERKKAVNRLRHYISSEKKVNKTSNKEIMEI